MALSCLNWFHWWETEVRNFCMLFFFKNWHYNIEETLFPLPLFQELIGRTPCVLSSCIGCRRAQGCDGESPAWARVRNQRGDLLLRI